MTPRVSILICTRNRAASLRETLRAMAGVRVPSDLPAELIVIDNGSTDGTRAVVESCRLESMPARHVLEPRAGKGHAYNRGIAESSGEVLLWTDDDVRPPVDWIEGMCRPIVDGEADAVAGGVVFPPAQARAAAVMPEWFASTYDIDPRSPGRLVGANMAFARRVLEVVPGFDTALGPGALGFGDEMLFGMQLMEAGFGVAARLECAVEHHFDLSRATRAALLRSAEGMGRSQAYIDHHWRHIERRYPLWLTARMAAGLWGRRLARFWRALRGRTDRAELERAMWLAYRRAFLAESKRPRRYARRGMAPLGAGQEAACRT